MRLEDLPAHRLAGLLPLLEDLRHDLGKYVCFETRFVGLDASDDALRAALRADLLATRRQGGEVEAAWELWARLRPVELAGDPDLAEVDAAVADLRGSDLGGGRGELLAAAGHARRVREATQRLASRARQAAEAAGLDPDEL